MPSGTTRKQVARHCYAAPCVELPTCVAERYPTLRICGYMSARSASLRKKNSSAVPLFTAVTCRQSAPDPLREKGRFARGWKTVGCLPSCAPARRQRKSPLRFSENLLPVRGEYAYEVRVLRSICAERKNTRGIENASGVTFLSVTRDWMIPFLYVSFQKQV